MKALICILFPVLLVAASVANKKALIISLVRGPHHALNKDGCVMMVIAKLRCQVVVMTLMP